jgi:PAS domain S-box-containing protein
MIRKKTSIRVRRPARKKAGPDSTRQSERMKLEEAFLLQQQLLAARDYAEAVIEAVPPLLVLDEKLRVQTANESFCNCFKIPRDQALNRRVYELGNGQWNIPRLRTLLEEVLLRKRAFKDFEVTHEFEGIGRRTMRLSGRQVDHLKRILLFIEDITEQRASQAAMRSSEIRYRRLFEAARDGILILEPATRKITDANPFMTELLGYPHEELLGKELWEIGLLKDETASRSAFRALRKDHFIRYEDLPLQNKAGHRHEVEFVSNLYEEDNHQVIQCNIRDITERKQAEEALRRNEERYRSLFNSIDEGFCVIEMLFDEDGKPADYQYCEVNPSFAKQTGMHGVLGKRMRELVPSYEAHWYETYGNVALTGKPVRLEKEATALKRWFDVYAFRIGGSESRKVAVLFTNITERRLSEQALLSAKNEIGRHALELEQVVTKRTAELRATIGELEGFSYSVSHDMRAPLRAMQSYAHFLVEDYGGRLDERAVNYLHQIMRSAVRLDRLIQDVLSYTKILHAILPIGDVNMDHLVRDIIDSLPDGQPIKPEVHIKGALPHVMGNEALLGQCVSNLLSNGVKFISPGTTPSVEIWAEETALTEAGNGETGGNPPVPSPAQQPGSEGGRASVKVFFRDNGIGIAPEDRERIFRLFERIHPPTEYEGTGIGLTIVRKAAERMGAQVGFDSEPGKGSKFWIQLKKG